MTKQVIAVIGRTGDREPRIAAANALCPEELTGFADRARINLTTAKGKV
jgi:hypothetical protein